MAIASIISSSAGEFEEGYLQSRPSSRSSTPYSRLINSAQTPLRKILFHSKFTNSMNKIMQLNYLKGARLSETSTVKMLSILKALAQCHVVLGLVMFIISAAADFMSSRTNTVRLNALEECCSFYFVVTGLIGLCGAASYRRGLVITFLVMSIHAIIIFVPAIIIVSSFDIHFYNHECYGECDWHLLATSLPSDSRCQILCGEHVTDNHRVSMTRLGTDLRLDAGLISLAILELILSLATAIISAKTICYSAKDSPTEMVPLNGESRTAA